MYAVFRYSTGIVLCYFVDESSAKFYCDDQNRMDRELTESLNRPECMFAYVPDWGYRLMSIADSVDELTSNFGEDKITVSDWYGDNDD